MRQFELKNKSGDITVITAWKFKAEGKFLVFYDGNSDAICAYSATWVRSVTRTS